MTDNPLQTATPAGVGSGDVIRDQDKIMLVLAYLGILALIPLLTVKDSDYVKFHAKQGLVLGVGILVVMIVLGFIPIINLVAGCVLPLGYLVLTIFAIIQAFKPNRWRIPLVSTLADKF